MDESINDSTTVSYDNSLEFAKLNLSIIGRLQGQNPFYLYYEAGITFVPNYDLTMHYTDSHSNPPDLEATGTALGGFAAAGMNIRITKLVSFNTHLAYSFIPIDPTYTNNNATLEEHSNLGGLMLKMGISFSF